MRSEGSQVFQSMGNAIRSAKDCSAPSFLFRCRYIKMAPVEMTEWGDGGAVFVVGGTRSTASNISPTFLPSVRLEIYLR